MPALVVVGAQWGDEGKGKVVDLLAARFDVVARYQGGHNAGHTVKFADQHFSLRLIPSGILHDGTLCIIGNGVVVDLAALLGEIDNLRAAGIRVDPGNLIVSDRAHVILPHHRELDLAREGARGAQRIGTTGRGIGPAYEAKAGREGLRLAEVCNPARVRGAVDRGLVERNLVLREAYGAAPIDAAAVAAETLALGERLRPFIADTGSIVNRLLDEGKGVLMEGAQGTMLDVDHGTYPYVTSSSSMAGGASIGLGIGPTRIDAVLGVVKAYSTRVGSGPFPTELPGTVGERLRSRGNEYGTVTGRPRRCGWYDGVAARYAVRINGLAALALMKIDVLDQFEEIPVCTGYRFRGKLLAEPPASAADLAACQPELVTLPGWGSPTAGLTREEDLPARAREYVSFLAEISGCPIELVSTGPRREETMLLPGFDAAISG